MKKTIFSIFCLLGAITSSAWAQEIEAEPPYTQDIILGDEAAPLTIYEYASLTCPHCDDFHTHVFPQLQEKYIDTGKVNLILREVYFDGPGLLAASLARCVPSDKYYPIVKTLYDTDEAWLRSQTEMAGVIAELVKIGGLAGLTQEEAAACLDNRDMREAMVANSQKHISEDKISGTPTLVIDGEALKSWQWEDLDQELTKRLGE